MKVEKGKNNFEVDTQRDTSCWVCIFKLNELSKYSIVYTVDIKLFISNNKPHNFQLLYVRSFRNLFDGIAHKYLLQQLSDDSLDAIIARSNPTGTNLLESIIC